jgi:hypothetical protein
MRPLVRIESKHEMASTLMNRKSKFRFLMTAGFFACGPAALYAAKPAIEWPQPTASVTGSATPFNPTYVATNVLDVNSQTEYASQGQGVNTFIDFDLGTPTAVTHFHHTNRTAADGITSSQLIFSDDPTFTSNLTFVPIVHTSQQPGVNYPIGEHTARYVRWDVTGISGAATNQGAREIAFLYQSSRYAQIGDPAITNSATQHSAGFPVGNVLDNVPTTDYASQGLGANTFIDFDFGAPTRISGFEHDNRSGHPLDAILGSDLLFSDDPTFTTGVTTVPITHAVQEGAVVYGFEEQVARYVRWDVTNVQPGGVAGNQGAAEIGFFRRVPDEQIGLPAPTVTNASPAHSAPYAVANMFDGNPITDYASAAAGVGTFVEMDFGSTQRFEGVEHLDRNPFVDWITGAKLTFSTDPVFDGSDPTITYDQLSAAYETFAPIHARYVKWEVTGVTAGNSNNVGGRELAFYGTPIPEPGSVVLCGLGVGGLLLAQRRLRRKPA